MKYISEIILASNVIVEYLFDNKMLMPYSTKSCAVIGFYTPIIYHVIQRKCRDNMLSDDVDAGSKVKFFDSKVDTKKPDSALYMGKVSHYYDIFSISVVLFIDEQRNNNDTMILIIIVLENMIMMSNYLNN